MPTKDTQEKDTKATKSQKTEKTEAAEKHSAKAPEKVAGKDMATAGFAVAVASIFTNIFTFGLIAVIGLVLSIMGRVQTAKAGHPSNLALAGIIISGVVMALTFMLFMFFLMLAILSANAEPATGGSGERCTTSMMRVYGETCVQQDSPLYQFRRSQG
jgi:hypothetical protein